MYCHALPGMPVPLPAPDHQSCGHLRAERETERAAAPTSEATNRSRRMGGEGRCGGVGDWRCGGAWVLQHGEDEMREKYCASRAAGGGVAEWGKGIVVCGGLGVGLGMDIIWAVLNGYIFYWASFVMSVSLGYSG